MENTSNRIRLDDVLDKFSIFGRYHLQFMLFAFFMFSYAVTFGHNYIFAAEHSVYRCIDEVFSNNTCGTVNGERCSEWIYDNPHGFMAEFQLACQEWKRTLVGTIHSFGYMLGLLIQGPLSDRVGRKTIFILTSLTGAVIGVTKSFSNSYWLYVTLEFLGTLLGDNYGTFYMLNLEIVSAKNRVVFNFLCNMGSFVGGILFPLLAWGIPYWRNLLLVIYATAFLFMFAYYLIDESPRWLLIKGETKRARAVLEKMAEKNKVKLDKDVLDRLSVENDLNLNFVSVLKLTFRSRTLLKRCLVCITWWITSTFVHHGMMINSVSLEGNKYLNYAITSSISLPGNLVLMYVLHNYKRRNPLICAFFAAAVLCFVQPLLPRGHPWLSVATYVAGTFMSVLFFKTTYMYTSELFPTYTRNSMHALCSSLGRLGAILAPQTPLLLAYWSGLPTLIFGCASLAAGLVTFLVPDTADDSLPDTVWEAEQLGNKNRRLGGIENLGMTHE